MSRHAACPITAFLLTVLFTVVSGCSSAPGTYRGELSRMIDSPLPPELQDRILELNPDYITGQEIREVLSHGPAPRIINLNGSLPVVTMDSFSRFLIAMGYPERSIRIPGKSGLSYSSYINSKKLAGQIAWYYEKDGMMPILIGHSQGGMKVIQVLHELAGAFNARIPVRNPITGETETRYTITDPLNGFERDVVGLRLGYASAITTGRLMRFLLLQWDMLKRLRQIPDTVEEFSGFSIVHDMIGSDLPGSGQYYPLGSSTVRNVRLPSDYSHIRIIQTEHLAQSDATRQWIDTYSPSAEEPTFQESLNVKTDNILFAAEIWYNIKKHWCSAVQKLMREKRRMNSSDQIIRQASQRDLP